MASATAASADVQPNIIGGHSAVGDTSWMASLQYDAPTHNRFDSHTCGASLVFRGWAVTNAHCVTDMPTGLSASQKLALMQRFDMDATSGAIPVADKHFKVRVGSKDRTQGGEMAKVGSITVHKGWNWGQTRGAEVDDIAVLQLDHDVDGQPIPLAGSPAQPGDTVTLYGWGIDQPSSTGTLPRKLQQLTTTVATPDRCAAADPTISAKEICAENPNGTDGTCYGDSGGPAVQVVDGVPALVGGTSRSAGAYCGRAPTIYTSTPEFRAFVYDTARGMLASRTGRRLTGTPIR